MYDIAIIGLGPAGSTLARLLNKKYKVIAIDRKNNNKSKCCGGLLSPDSQKILASFNLCLPKDVLVDPQIFSVKTLDFDNNIEKKYQRFYINMDRKKFDDWLISLIPTNTKIVANSICTKITKEEENYEITYQYNKELKKIKTKIVIGADGANSIVRNTLYPNDKIKKYVSIQEWYENNNQEPVYTSIFDKKLTNSYSWTISKNNFFIVGGAFPQYNCNEKFNLLKEKLISKGYKLDKLVKREGCFVYLSTSINSVCTGKNNAYLVGEASGMISPSSLEGISYAMESGKILANILNKKLLNSNKQYHRKTRKLRLKLKLKILKRPFMYNKLIRKIVMKSNIKTIK